ncbi:hypothetical protein DMB95_03630 [Campylobacter sp. MIT 12-8780]|uniref:hypothetical protein n=1 Tax=unclassified Campylobacter TaxID=2593542 RepID=UPI00115DDDC0|nr:MULTISPECIES: hypothetical protein [unclassified Campylobacter]NDJ26845.1 hypothetical protein [Campylobacter sp. MIT 19-121]TQR42009.1 hypothetical protein DMB95_03630 [Campylobacter sp. MIT 12-8780]
MNGGLVYISSVIVFNLVLNFIGIMFIVNVLCFYALNFIKYTSKFINFYFLVGEFFGNCIVGVAGFYLCVFIDDTFFEFQGAIFVAILVISLILMILNMLFLLIRYSAFEYGLNYKKILHEKAEIKMWIMKSLIFGALLSSFLTCLCISAFVLLLR